MISLGQPRKNQATNVNGSDSADHQKETMLDF
jgi:hypothetical protein